MKQEKLKGSFTYEPPTNTYTATVKKPYQWWWWLLLLLLFLPLFIRCERTITVKVVDADGNPIENVKVSASSSAHYFLAHSKSYNEVRTTGKDGEAIFYDVDCSFYCWLFHHGKDISFSAEPPSPYLSASKWASKHSDDYVTITLDEQGFPVEVQVIDAFDQAPLSGAEVVVTRSGSGLGTFYTDAGGIAVIPDIKRRDKLSIAGRKQGYETNDTTLASVTGKDLMVTPPRVIPLTKKFECNDNVCQPGGGVFTEFAMDMLVNSGTFYVELDACYVPDNMQIFDANGKKIFESGMVSGTHTFSNIRFETRMLTFRLTSDDSGTVWYVYPHCAN